MVALAAPSLMISSFSVITDPAEVAAASWKTKVASSVTSNSSSQEITRIDSLPTRPAAKKGKGS